MHSRVPLIAAGVFGLLVVLSIIPVLVGEDPLSAVFAVILGLPWSSLLSNLIGSGASDPGIGVGLAVLVVSGAINAALVYVVARLIVHRRRASAA